jgi:chromosome segregation ATPase
MLGSANNEISLRAAAINARNTQLTIQLEGLGARLTGAEQQIQEREAALAAARTAMLEKDSGLRQLQGHVAALRQQLVEAQQGEMKQGNCIRQVAPAWNRGM